MNLSLSLKSYLTILLAITAITGDYIVSHSQLHIFQAIFDNATHCIIGGLSWFLVCIICKRYHSFQTLFEVGICALISSLIDVDHFIAARSISLKDATNLKQRPSLHISTFPAVACTVLLLINYWLQIDVLQRSVLVVFTAFSSHHTRDATRRGFWFYPLGSTPPIPYVIYVALTCTIPHFVGALLQYMTIYRSDIIKPV